MLASAMALSGVAQAKPISDKADAQCAKLAIKTFGPSFNPSTYTVHGGTVGEDNFTFVEGSADGSDVYCGFGSNDQIDTLNVGDIFLGGEGIDEVSFNDGTFNGEAGNDHVCFNTAIFNGEGGNDSVTTTNTDIFNGGDGDDSVGTNDANGTFNGGDGTDTVTDNQGTIINVE